VELGTVRIKSIDAIEIFTQGCVRHQVSGDCSGQQYGMDFSLPQPDKTDRPKISPIRPKIPKVAGFIAGTKMYP
jgi:hypothetical protein